MRYAEARWNLYQREEVYRIYVTDLLKAQGNFTEAKRYIDFFEPQEEGPQRTAEDIINAVSAALNGGKTHESV